MKKIQRSKWRTAVYLLRMSQKRIARQEKERHMWAEAQSAKREKDREARVDEWIACERRRATQPRPPINVRRGHQYGR